VENRAVQPQYSDRRQNAAAKAVPPGGATATAIAEDRSDRASWLLCRAGAHLCALPTAHVIEIMRILPIEAISGAPSYVRGLSVIRGVPVAVVDTGLLLGEHATRCGRLVTIRAGTRTIALAVETIEGIRAIGADACLQLPPLLGDAATAAVDAIGTLDAELLFFLRTARIVPDDVLARLSAEGAAS
jgi:purine-binding chemotaxis protein CheW